VTARRQEGRAGAAETSPWLLGVGLTTTMIAASAFQFVLGALAPVLTAELGISRLQLGAVTTVYYLVAAVASSVLGKRVHLLSRRVGTMVLYVLSAFACALVAVIANGWALVVGAAVAGMAAGLCNPVTNLVIAARPGPHGALIGTKQAGVQMSAFLVGSLMPLAAVSLGWRIAFALLSAVLVFAGLGVAFSTAQSQLQHSRSDGGGDGRLPYVVRWLCGYAFFMGAGMATLNTYVVLYAHDHVGMSIATSGLLLAVLGLSGALARIINSIIAERSIHLGAWLVGSGAVAAAGVVLITWSPDASALWAGALVVGVSGCAWNGMVMLAVLRTCPHKHVGHATGVVLAGFFVGLAAAPPLFGGIVDAFRSYTPGWLLTIGCFALATALAGAMARNSSLRPPSHTATAQRQASVSNSL